MNQPDKPTWSATAFTGLMVATLTPFDPSNRLDRGVIYDHTQFLIGSGVTGLCPAGTTGEFFYLSGSEKRDLILATVKAAAGICPVIAGIWDRELGEIARLAQFSEECGADAVFLPPPIYYPAGDDAVVQYYAMVRASTSLPVFCYNIPAYASNAISLPALDRLVEAGTVAGIKDSTGQRDRMLDLITRYGKTITVLAASDGFAGESRELGAAGFISALANIVPTVFVELWNGEKDMQAAIKILREAVKRAGGIPALKYLAGLQGIQFGESRLPLSQISSENMALLENAYRAVSELV
ncbi:MAG: dihydrodipicolinate synthase family protein [Armatimonadetes bacterium]|nr:dihydrodipicolinate synthase family protein [Armatimonadota bacterium]